MFGSLFPSIGITIVGDGAVSPNVNPQMLVVGKTYTLTAMPAAGQVFVGWSGTFTSKNSKLTFTYRTNVQVQANFITSPYYPVAGTYNGLFYEDTGVRLPSSGAFNVVVTKAGTYSGKLQIGIKKLVFTGKLSLDLVATNRLVIGGFPVILDFTPQDNRITGHLTSGLWVSSVLADRARFNSLSNPAPYIGKYTMVVPGVSGDPLLPAGHGYGAVSVGGSGIAVFGGTLADGTKVTQSAFLSENGQWPFYIPLYSGKGSVLSWLAFADRVNDDINGTLNWIKLPSGASKYYRGGFDFDSDAIGSTYTIPGVGTNILNLTTAQLTFDGGNLGSGFVNSVSFGTNSHLTNLSSNGLSVAFSPGKGTFLGKVVKPTGGKPVSFSGVVLQKANAGYGFLLGTNQSSQVLLAP